MNATEQSHPNLILVTTAGKVGAEAARLVAGTVPARVLVRDSRKAGALSRAGVDVIAGDLTDPASVRSAMRGVTGVVLVSPAAPEQEIDVIDSAARAGVGHVVKITSTASADSPVARRRDQHAIELALLASGIPHTLLRSNAYLQNLLMLAPSVAATDGFGSSTGDGRIGMVDARDVASVAASIAIAPTTHAGRTYWPSGPHRISYPDVADVLTRASGRPIAFRHLTAVDQRQAMIDAGMPASLAEMNTRALALFAEGDADWVTDDVLAITGRPPRSLEQFVNEHLDAFS